MKLRSELNDYLYIRDCYEILIDDIFTSLRVLNTRKTVAILGTAGIGKSSMFLVLLKLLLEDPTKFGLEARSFYYQNYDDRAQFYQHDGANEFSVHIVDKFHLLEKFPLFADMATSDGSPWEHSGITLIFTSFRPSRYKERTKSGWLKVMPTWSADEQADFFNSTQFRKQYGDGMAQKAYDNIFYFGGSIRNNIRTAVMSADPIGTIEEAIKAKGINVCEQFFRAGFGGTEADVSDLLVHRNPVKNIDGVYNFNDKPCAFSFASPYVFRKLLALHKNILVNDARSKYNVGTFHGGDDGNEFELLCLHGFKISDVEFCALPLTDGAQQIQVKFPPKEVLARNWRDVRNYLKANVLYIPPYGNLESGDAFCLIEINGRWTLVILQCTIAESHPVKQNGVKIIRDCYTEKSELLVDDTVIMFMIPENGKLKKKQRMVTQMKGGVLEAVQRVTVIVSAQYKIENNLVTVDIVEE